MALIACNACRNKADAAARACPKCGAKLVLSNGPSWTKGQIIVITVWGVMILSVQVSALYWSDKFDLVKVESAYAATKESGPEGLPPKASTSPTAPVPFKVAAKDGINVILLIPKNTGNGNLRNLLGRIHCAHRTGNLGQLGIPPTTPGGSKGPYFAVQVYIFDDPESANTKRLKQFNKLDETAKDFRSLNDAFTKKIRAYYMGQPLHLGTDNASIGFKDHDGRTTPTYERVALPSTSECRS